MGHDWMSAMVAAELRRVHEMIETACESALLTEFGVLVKRVGFMTVSAEPHPDVPYGTIIVITEEI